MIVLLAALVVAVLTAAVVLTLGYWRHSERVSDRAQTRLNLAAARTDARAEDRLVGHQLAERLVVSMKSGDGFAGLLIDHDARTLKLREAMGISKAGERAPVDGELLIPRAEVAYVQRPVG